VEVLCSSLPLPLDDYIQSIGDVDRVITMLVGDTQRIWVYPDKGWAIEQPVPDDVHQAYSQLVDAGYTSRLLAGLKTVEARDFWDDSELYMWPLWP
jgi:hypothetical protein